MHFTRSHVYAAVLLAGLGLTASIAYLGWSGAGSSGAAGTSSLESSPVSENPASLVTTAATTKLAMLDLACESEPLKQKAKSLRERAEYLAGVARNFASRVGLQDANFEDAAAEVTLPLDPAAMARMQDEITTTNAAVDRWIAEMGPVLDHDFEAFMKDLEKRTPALMVTTIPVEYEDSKKKEESLRAAGVPAGDPRRKSAQANMQLYRDQLLRFGSGLHPASFQEDSYVLKHLQNPSGTIAEYRTAKTQYLAVKAEAAETQQRYEAARLVPLPAARTKDWRLPAFAPRK